MTISKLSYFCILIFSFIFGFKFIFSIAIPGGGAKPASVMPMQNTPMTSPMPASPAVSMAPASISVAPTASEISVKPGQPTWPDTATFAEDQKGLVVSERSNLIGSKVEESKKIVKEINDILKDLQNQAASYANKVSENSKKLGAYYQKINIQKGKLAGKPENEIEKAKEKK